MNFSVEDFEKGKLKNKAALQNKLGLEENPEARVALAPFVCLVFDHWRLALFNGRCKLRWLLQGSARAPLRTVLMR